MALVDDAARVGERGGHVATWLGRGSARIDAASATTGDGPIEGDTAGWRATGREASERGRFTRNFIVQGTAAEWALVWLGEVRAALAEMAPAGPTSRTSAPFAERAHLVYFLHDELIVHTPAVRAAEVARCVEAAAARAARRLFGRFPIDFPLEVRIGDDASGHEISRT